MPTKVTAEDGTDTTYEYYAGHRSISKINHPSFPTPQHSEKNEIIASAVRAGSS